MTAERAAQQLRRRVRLLCVITGLLCTVGVLSGAALRAGEAAHHHGHSVAAVTVATVAHSTSPRSVSGAVTTSPATVSNAARWAYAHSPAASAPAAKAVDSVRTRGPPAPA